jgi:hypothetical protein
MFLVTILTNQPTRHVTLLTEKHGRSVKDCARGTCDAHSRATIRLEFIEARGRLILIAMQS